MRMFAGAVLGALLGAFDCTAQTVAAPNQPSREQVTGLVSGLMYARNMVVKCPLDKKLSDGLDMFAMVASATLPKLSSEETAELEKSAYARAEADRATSKDEACQRSKQAIEMMLKGLDAVLTKQPTKRP